MSPLRSSWIVVHCLSESRQPYPGSVDSRLGIAVGGDRLRQRYSGLLHGATQQRSYRLISRFHSSAPTASSVIGP
jgi:hypothetical protein